MWHLPECIMSSLFFIVSNNTTDWCLRPSIQCEICSRSMYKSTGSSIVPSNSGISSRASLIKLDKYVYLSEFISLASFSYFLINLRVLSSKKFPRKLKLAILVEFISRVSVFKLSNFKELHEKSILFKASRFGYPRWMIICSNPSSYMKFDPKRSVLRDWFEFRPIPLHIKVRTCITRNSCN